MDNHVSTPSPPGEGHNNQLTLFPATRLSEQAEIAVTDDVRNLLEAGAPVALCVSGGKDSSAVAIRTSEYLDSIGHCGPRILVHSDLGRIEWRQSLPVCERLAKHVGLDLVVVRRRKGDLLDRFWQREAAQSAKNRAALREDAESHIPERLLFKKGRPTCVPSFAEAELLAEIRTTVASIVGLTIGFTDADAIRARYADLYQAALAA